MYSTTRTSLRIIRWEKALFEKENIKILFTFPANAQLHSFLCHHNLSAEEEINIINRSMEASQNASSSGSSQHYSVMIAQLSELRQELEKAASQNQSLVEQNKSLQGVYHAIKGELSECKKKYSEAQEYYLQTVAEKFEMEQQNESFMESIKRQLTEKTQEFEALRDKFAPQDIDYIRIKVQEELEVPHRAKIVGLEKEVEKQREAYFAMRRNFEMLKIEHETQGHNHSREINALRDAHDTEIAALKRSMTALRDREYNPEKDEQVRLASIKAHELEGQLKSLTLESRTLRMERDNALIAADQAQSRHDEAYVALRTRCTIAETDIHAVSNRCSGLMAEIEKKESTIFSLTQNLDEVDKQASYFKTLSTDREAHLLREKASHEAETAHIRETYDKQLEELEEKNDMLQSKLRDREEALRRAQREANEMQIRAESLESELRKTYFHQLLEARQRSESLELELCEVRESQRHAEMQMKISLEQSSADCDRLRSENSRLAREKDVLHGHLRDLELRNEGERRSVAEAKRAREEVQRLLKGRDSEIAAVRHTLDELNMEITNLNDAIVRKDLEHKKQWEYVQGEVKKRYEALGLSYKRKLEESIKKGRSAVLKERKRADAYKTRAIELHRKHKHFQVTTGQPS